MEIKISVLSTNVVTKETVVKDFDIKDDEWDCEKIEVPLVNGKVEKAMNESFNAFCFLWDGFEEILKLPEDLDFDNDVEAIFPVYSATDIKKRKRGYIYDFKEKDGIKTRIILIAPRHYLNSIL